MQLSSPWSPVEVHQHVASPRDEVFNLLKERFRPPVKGEDDAEAVEDVAVEAHGHRELIVEQHVGPLRGEVTFSLVKRGDDETEIVMRERPLGPVGFVTPLLRPAMALRNRLLLRDLVNAR